MAQQDRTDPAYLVPGGRPGEPLPGFPDEDDLGCPDEPILEVLPEGDPEASDLLPAPCLTCGGRGEVYHMRVCSDGIARNAWGPCPDCREKAANVPAKAARDVTEAGIIVCHHCGGRTVARGTHPTCGGCGRSLTVEREDPEAADLFSPGESAALMQEVAERTDESFRQLAAKKSERCDKMARELAELRDRMRKELKLVERQHARYASRADLLRRYLSDDPTSPEVPL